MTNSLSSCWLASLVMLASCTNINQSLSASFQSSTQSTGSPTSRASTDTTNSSGGTSGASNQSSSGQSSSIVAASALLLAVGGGITSAVYATQARSRPVQPRKKKVKKARRDPFDDQAPAPALLPEEVAPPLPLPDPATLPAEPTPPPLPPSVLLPGGPTLDALVLARAWLLANGLQLEQDLALGAGPSLEDLAGLAGIAPERRARFGEVLQRHRAVLRSPPDLTVAQAGVVMSRVGDLVMADPFLRIDGEAVLAQR